MALRDLSDCGEIANVAGASAVVWLPAYWDSPGSAAKIGSEEWWNLFMVVVNTNYSESVDEILRNVTANRHRIAALINNLNEQVAERKLVSLQLFSLEPAARKNLIDIFRQMIIATVLLREFNKNCEQVYIDSRNRTLERYNIFARKQKDKETAPILADINGHCSKV